MMIKYCLVKEYSILTWANIPVFDYKSRLLKGHYRLHMWPRQEHMELYDSCYPIGVLFFILKLFFWIVSILEWISCCHYSFVLILFYCSHFVYVVYRYCCNESSSWPFHHPGVYSPWFQCSVPHHVPSARKGTVDSTKHLLIMKNCNIQVII